MKDLDVATRMRQMVADHLGVDEVELEPAVSLTDELAADSLDLLALALDLEEEFDVTLPEEAVGRVHAYGDLVELVAEAMHRRECPAPEAEPTFVRTSLVAPGGGAVERASWLTAYDAETIAEEALRAGRGAALAVHLPGEASAAAVAAAEARFAPLAARGVHVEVLRDGHPGAVTPRPQPTAHGGA